MTLDRRSSERRRIRQREDQRLSRNDGSTRKDAGHQIGDVMNRLGSSGTAGGRRPTNAGAIGRTEREPPISQETVDTLSRFFDNLDDSKSWTKSELKNAFEKWAAASPPSVPSTSPPVAHPHPLSSSVHESALKRKLEVQTTFMPPPVGYKRKTPPPYKSMLLSWRLPPGRASGSRPPALGAPLAQSTLTHRSATLPAKEPPPLNSIKMEYPPATAPTLDGDQVPIHEDPISGAYADWEHGPEPTATGFSLALDEQDYVLGLKAFRAFDVFPGDLLWAVWAFAINQNPSASVCDLSESDANQLATEYLAYLESGSRPSGAADRIPIPDRAAADLSRLEWLPQDMRQSFGRYLVANGIVEVTERSAKVLYIGFLMNFARHV